MSRLLKALYQSGWEFWIPLPLVAIALWTVGNAIAHHVLTRPDPSIHPLQAKMPLNTHLPVTVLAIQAEIDRQHNISTVSVRVTNPELRVINYTFSVVEVSLLEAAIAEKLNISIDRVRKIASYRIQD